MIRLTKKEADENGCRKLTYNSNLIDIINYVGDIEDKIEDNRYIPLPDNVVLDEYDKERISKIQAEDIKFEIGAHIFKVYDTVIHFANKPPKKPQYKIVEGHIRNIYHKYNQYKNRFCVRIEVTINEKGHYQIFDQANIFFTREAAEACINDLNVKPITSS